MGRKSSAVYNVNYHFIWCPKYRKPILEEAGIKEFLEDQIHTIAATKECEVLALEVMPDHVHLFISTTPFESPTGIVKVLKGVTALRLFKKFPELRNKYWKGKLWSPSYYVGTAGHVSAETIQKYIEEQIGTLRNSSTH
jgi:putative transposase